jgi:hypothetical protein
MMLLRRLHQRCLWHPPSSHTHTHTHAATIGSNLRTRLTPAARAAERRLRHRRAVHLRRHGYAVGYAIQPNAEWPGYGVELLPWCHHNGRYETTLLLRVTVSDRGSERVLRLWGASITVVPPSSLRHRDREVSQSVRHSSLSSHYRCIASGGSRP